VDNFSSGPYDQTLVKYWI